MNNYIAQAVSANGIGAFLLVSLLLNYGRKHQDAGESNKLFKWMLITNLMQCIVEPVTLIIDGKMFAGAIEIATLLNAFLYMNNIIFSVLWAFYADAKVRRGKPGNRTVRILMLIPAAVIVTAAMVNLLTPVFFRITQDNVYERTWGFIPAYVLTYFYLLMGTLTIYLHRKKTEQYNFMPVFTFLFPVLTASVIQFLVPGISLIWVGAAIGLTSAYMSLLDESALTDRLSGLFSRHYFNMYLSRLPSRFKEGKPLVGMMLDVDDFKRINDAHGHLTGDDAIMAVGHILRRAIEADHMIFRYAGDEFVVIMPLERESDVNNIVARIHNESEHFNLTQQKPYKIRFSVGYTFLRAGDDPNAFVARMDEEMYRNKKKNKENV